MERSWCFATEVDLYDTFIGGTEDCVSAVLAAADLEAFRVAARTESTQEGHTEPVDQTRRGGRDPLN